eukprot:720671-Prorocentrum_lima.AAC.1
MSPAAGRDAPAVNVRRSSWKTASCMPRVHVATSALACSVPLRVRSRAGSSLGELRADDDSGRALSKG